MMVGGPGTGGVEVLELSISSQDQRLKYESTLLELEAKALGNKIDVPTLPEQVRASLRGMGLPVRLFGENLANVRDRLRMELARQQLMLGPGVGGDINKGTEGNEAMEFDAEEDDDEEEEVTKYTRASPELVAARQDIANFSVQNAAKRLQFERQIRMIAAQSRKRTKVVPDEQLRTDHHLLTKLDQKCVKLYQTLRRTTLEGSQYGDTRALSCICTDSIAGMPIVVTGSWTGGIQVWNGSSPALESLGKKTIGHEDRIMGSDIQTLDDDVALVATASLDMSGKLWKIQKSDMVLPHDVSADAEPPNTFTITECAHLKGHVSRLCRTAFHPMKRHVATTSFDHTWRLWDIESGSNLLLQDGHWKECFGIGFHPDGSLCATTDFAGVIHIWDLRTGKSIKHFEGHAKRVLNAEFHPNGFQLATSGDDGTIKIWDLRRRKLAVSLPAHSNVVTRMKFDKIGEYLASSSFDGTVKLWACRDWKLLNQLVGHDGKVSCIAILENNSMVSCGFDKTLKLWG